MMRNENFWMIGLFSLFTCFFVIIPASAQQGEQTVECPPNSSWDGTQCKCSPGYGSRDGSNCRPLAELAQCPPNSSWDGTQCKCSPGYGSRDGSSCQPLGELNQCPPNSSWDGTQCKCSPGYGSLDGSSCRPLAELAQCPPNSHVQGTDCVCNDGFGSIDGKCVSMSAACAKFNARWSPGKGDCECAPGFHEDTAANKCVQDAPLQQNADKKPVNKQEEQASVLRPKQPVQKNQTATEDGKVPSDWAGNSSIKITPQNNQQAEVIDASSTPTGNMTIPVTVGGKTVFTTEAGAEAYQKHAESQIPADIAIKKDISSTDVFTRQQKGETYKENEKKPAKPPSTGWWSDPGQKPVTTPDKKQPASVNAGIPAKPDTEKRQDPQPVAKFQQLPDEPVQKETASKPAEKPVIPLPPLDVPDIPEKDLYKDISPSDQPPLEKTIADSLKFTIPEKKEEVEEQLKTLSSFDNADASEVTLEKKGIVEVAAEELVRQEYLKQLRQWEDEIKKAKETGKVKKGMDKEDYLIKAEMEQRSKWQIAEIEKIIGYNHGRLIEASGVMKFELMGTDYREHFGNKSAADDFNAASEGVESNKAFRNIQGLNKQLKDLKKRYQKEYPKGWEEKYLDLPEKPRIEPIEKKVEENIFVIFEKGVSK